VVRVAFGKVIAVFILLSMRREVALAAIHLSQPSCREGCQVAGRLGIHRVIGGRSVPDLVT
jgi:hypothetical protein